MQRSLTTPFQQEWEELHQLRANSRLLEMATNAVGDELQIQQQLRREFSDTLVRDAMSLVAARKKAVGKFSLAEKMWLDRRGLEQATAEAVARHKATRFSGEVLDLCCGIGSDAIALARHCDVVAVDKNPVVCLRAKWNAKVAECSSRIQFLCADAEQIDPGDRQVHLDPDRRVTRQSRSVRLEDSVPGLEFMQQLTELPTGGAIKLSPAANFGGKFPGCEIELISLDGECKEATVWYGKLAGPKSWRATVLPSGESLTGDPLEIFAEVTPLGGYLYDPDPAIVRAGLVDAAAEKLGLSRLDDSEEYLTGSNPVKSPFVRAFEVLAELPNNDNQIRRYFRQSSFGQVEIKCRHIPIQAEVVRRKLPLPGDKPGVLVFARIQGKARAIICRRID